MIYAQYIEMFKESGAISCFTVFKFIISSEKSNNKTNKS